MSKIEWKRELGSPDGITIVYSGAAGFGLAYQVHSMYAYSTKSRRVREYHAFRGTTGKRHLLGAYASLGDAQARAERDYAEQLAERGLRQLVRPAALPVTELMQSTPDGLRWRWWPQEMFDHYPANEPLWRLFRIDIDSNGDTELVCPCGASAGEVPLGFGEAVDAAIGHAQRKHGRD